MIISELAKSELADIESIGKQIKGRRELVNYLNGKRLTQRQAIAAHCYWCQGYYSDGSIRCEEPNCPLHPFNPKVIREAAKVASAKGAGVHRKTQISTFPSDEYKTTGGVL